jgi:DMSO/TMAO reductase YedYZ molybdopterin-dependent catalytic subunit
MKWAGLLLAVALVLGVLVLGGCGTSPEDVSTTTAALATTTTVQATSSTASQGSEPAGTAGALQITGPSGTKSYTLDELKAMPAVTGFWGAHKGDLPYPTNQYKGVDLTSLLAEVGGVPAGAGLEINTSDNFPCSYDAARVATVASGTYQAWDKVSGAEGTVAVQLIVAYEIDGKPLPTSGEGAGPLRLVPVVAEDKYVTEGKFSPYLMVSVKVVQ